MNEGILNELSNLVFLYVTGWLSLAAFITCELTYLGYASKTLTSCYIYRAPEAFCQIQAFAYSNGIISFAPTLIHDNNISEAPTSH